MDRSASNRGKPTDRDYTQLDNVKSGRIYNIYGVVDFLKQPLISTTKEHYLTLSIIDPSSAENSLKCILFYNELNEIPTIKSVGEVVRFHRLKVGEFSGKLQGQKGPGFSWLVVHGDHPDGTLDLDHSHKNYSFTDEDKEKIADLRQWANSLNELKQHQNQITLPKEMQLKDAVRALQESSTSALHPRIDFTPIRDILQFPIVPYKFRCRARVLYFEPNHADEIFNVVCSKCKTSAQLKDLPDCTQERKFNLTCSDCLIDFRKEYVFYLLLEDDTGIIHVSVCGDDATEFFADFPFDDLRCYKEVKTELEARLSDLIGGDLNIFDLSQDISHRPFFECCIKSYNAVWTDDETKNKICYRIFDTKLY